LTTLNLHGKGPEVPSNSHILLFPEKEAKSVCSASQKTNSRTRNLGEADPEVWGLPQKSTASRIGRPLKLTTCLRKGVTGPLISPEKKQKEFVLLRRRQLYGPRNSAKPTQGFGVCPKKVPIDLRFKLTIYVRNGPIGVVLFQKRSKKRCSVLQKTIVPYLKLRPSGLGLAPK
jgi:hypothetical protein